MSGNLAVRRVRGLQVWQYHLLEVPHAHFHCGNELLKPASAVAQALVLPMKLAVLLAVLVVTVVHVTRPAGEILLGLLVVLVAYVTGVLVVVHDCA